MPEWCTAKIRPFPNDVELQCQLLLPHEEHKSLINDTEIVWFEDDRRTFHGIWEPCKQKNCILPNKHEGRHAY